MANARRAARYDAARNASHGAAYLLASGAIQFASNPKQRWSRTNGFDLDIRNELRGGSAKLRRRADLASDLTLGLTAGLLPLASIGASFGRTHDCLESLEMGARYLEGMGLTLLITQATKFASGRERPFTEDCDVRPPRDAQCGGEDRHLSFFSGHASLSAAGAGLTCSFSLKRKAWGSSPSARISPCALGIAGALTTGALRITADKHWGTDVLIGFAVGAVVGYFDSWGPLDLLRFETRDSAGRVSAKGMVLPLTQGRTLGAQIVMTF